jgi:hypothetical protein
MTFLAAQILAAGKIPFLHVKSENGVKVVYEKIGFRLRAPIYLSVFPFAESVVTCEWDRIFHRRSAVFRIDIAPSRLAG